ncbi:MAG TPA: amidohydrolase family protein, partial [Paenirhodobacter sp.]
MPTSVTALRGQIVSLRANPFLQPSAACVTYHPDGLVIMQDGHILAAGPYDVTAPVLPAGVTPVYYPDHLIMPGFIDTHVHYPQIQMIGAYGEQLLEWLNTYTFVTEQQFSDRAHADRVAEVFLRELLRAGTTTAMVYCT